jgi:hypothetical protein
VLVRLVLDERGRLVQGSVAGPPLSGQHTRMSNDMGRNFSSPMETGMRRLATASIVLVVIASFYLVHAFQSGQRTTAHVPQQRATPAPGAWKIYYNHLYSYSIRYPPDWKATVYLDNAGTPAGKPVYVVQQGVEIRPKNAIAKEMVAIDVFQNPSYLSLIAWLNYAQLEFHKEVAVQNATIFGVGNPLPDRANYSIEGQPALLIKKNRSLQNPASTTIILSAGRHLYRLSLFGDDCAIYNRSHSRILSSLSLAK